MYTFKASVSQTAFQHVSLSEYYVPKSLYLSTHSLAPGIYSPQQLHCKIIRQNVNNQTFQMEA